MSIGPVGFLGKAEEENEKRDNLMFLSFILLLLVFRVVINTLEEDKQQKCTPELSYF